MKKQLVYLVGTCLTMASSLLNAATVSGVIYDDATNSPLEWASISAYRFNGNYYNYVGNTQTDASGNFSMTNLSAGTYYFHANGSWGNHHPSLPNCFYNPYMGEFYNDTQDWSLKTEITLVDTDNISLDPIGLGTYPVAACVRPVGSLSASGGTLSLEGAIINYSGTAVPVEAWINMEPQVNGWAHVTVIGPASLNISGAGIPFAVPYTIPATAPEGNYCFHVNVGASIYEPYQDGWGSWCANKPNTTVTNSSSWETKAPQIPDTVSTSGEVLTWRDQ